MAKDKKRKAMYDLWLKMIDRCYNTKNISYKYYGAKGITVCDEWKNSFDVFLLDMWPRPDGTSLDRKENKLGYSKLNCKWSTIKEQNNNKSDTRIIEFNGKSQNLTAWAQELGTSAAALHYRIVKMAMPVDLALKVPFSRSNTKTNMMNMEIK